MPQKDARDGLVPIAYSMECELPSESVCEGFPRLMMA
jgi:hypothetical protein